MDSLCDLGAVELRRRIGTKEISPVELLEACLERIEAVNPAVNAVTAMCVDRARNEAKAAETAVRRARTCGCCTACRPASRISRRPRTSSPPTARRSIATIVPAYDNVMVGRVRAAGADRGRQDQRAGVRRRLEQPQPGVGRHRQSVQSDAQSRRLVGRLGGGARHRHAAGLHRLGHRRLAAQSRRRSAASSASAPRPAWSRSSAAPWAGRRSRCWARWAARVADTLLLLQAQIGQHDSRIRSPSRSSRDDFAALVPVDLGSLRVAFTEDFGGAPVDPASAPPSASASGSLQSAFRSCEWRDPDMADADEAFGISAR